MDKLVASLTYSVKDLMQDPAPGEAALTAQVDDLPRRPAHGALPPHIGVAARRVVLGVAHGGEDEMGPGVVGWLLPGGMGQVDAWMEDS